MVLSESHQTKPIKLEDIKHFIDYFMSKDYLNHNERVEFFTKFISKIIYYNDRLIIIYNTKPNDSEEIVINSKEDIEKIENTIKNLEEKKVVQRNLHRTTGYWRGQCYPILTLKCIWGIGGLSCEL